MSTRNPNLGRSEPAEPGEHWTDCEAGEIQRVVSRLKQQRARHAVKQAAMAVVSCSLLVVSGLYAWPHLTSSHGHAGDYGGIACIEVMQAAEQYLAGTLNAALTASIDRHLKSCPKCARMIEDLRSRSATRPGSGTARAILHAPKVPADTSTFEIAMLAACSGSAAVR